MQRALIQYRNPKNYELVLEALQLAVREDLIGDDKRCLIRPKEGRKVADGQRSKKPTGEKKAVQPKKKKTIRNVHKKAKKKS